MVQILAVRGEVLRRHTLQELDILVMMKPAHVVCTGSVRSVDFHFVVKAIIQHQTMYDRQTVWFHRVRWPIVEVTHVRVVEVKHSLVGHTAAVATEFRPS